MKSFSPSIEVFRHLRLSKKSWSDPNSSVILLRNYLKSKEVSSD